MVCVELKNRLQWVKQNLKILFYSITGEKTNLRRNLDEANQKIAQLEEVKNTQQKEGEELRNNLRELEKARQEARRELQQLHNQVGLS